MNWLQTPNRNRCKWRQRTIALCALALLSIPAIPEQAPTAGAQPAYSTVKKDGRWWFRAPDGRMFFSRGVNVVHVGPAKDHYRPDKPEYAAFLYYPSTEAWARAALQRLKAWKFNTIGGWSQELLHQGPLPFTVVLSLGESAGVPWQDPFSPETERKFDENAKRQILALRDNPYLLGYFSDNELGWWSGSLFGHYLKAPDANYTRQELLRLLVSRYQDQLSAMRKDFDIGVAASFSELGRRGEVTLHPGGRGFEVVDEFMQVLAERYYRLAHDSIRRYDTHHLMLGDRFAAWYPQAVARAAAPYVDVISLNSGADWPDGEISPFLFKSLHQLTGKPVLISEFYMSARENRSGNRNSGNMFPTVETQGQRAAAFRRNLTSLAELPFVVGAHWFQYTDEPTHGREDGEDYNMGLVDIQDRPYEQLTSASSALDTDTIHHQSRELPLVADRVPVRRIAPAASLWEHRQSFIQNASGTSVPFADLYAAWDARNLYLVLYAADYGDGSLYADGHIAPVDAMLWSVHSGSAKGIRVRFDYGKPVVEEGVATADMKLKSTRFMVVLTISAAALGRSRLLPGDSISIESELASFGRLHSMGWKQTLALQNP